MRWAGGSSCAAASGSDTGLKVDRLAAASQGAAAFFWPVHRTNTTADALLAHLAASPDVLPQKLDLIRGLLPADRVRRGCVSLLELPRRPDPGAGDPGRAGCRSSASRPPHTLVDGTRPLQFHLSHGARRLDAGEPPARRDRAGPVAARAAAVADARRGTRRAARAGVAARTAAVRRCCSIRCCGSGVAATPRPAASSSRRRAARRAWRRWLLERSARSRAIYLNLRAEPALATLLAGAELRYRPARTWRPSG